MADPIILMYFEITERMSFDPLYEQLSGCGLSLSHPTTGAVSRRSEVGHQIASSREDVFSMVHDGQWVAIDFWADEAAAAHVSIGPIGESLFCESISMDTLDDSQIIAISKSAVSRFRSACGRRGLIIDLLGDSLEYIEWTSFFQNTDQPLDARIPTPVSPTVLGMDAKRFDSFATRFSDFAIDRFDSMVLASRPNRIEDFLGWRWERYRRIGDWVTIPPAKSQ